MIRVSKEQLLFAQAELNCGMHEAYSEAQRRQAKALVARAASKREVSEDVAEVLGWILERMLPH